MRVFLFVVLSVWVSGTVSAQEQPDTVKHEKPSRLELLIYTRTIWDAKGNVRFDQNLVPNFRLTPWLRMELGIRKGETSKSFDAYYHYKVELQTRRFWNTVRFIARLSDNVVGYTQPVYSKSNYLLIAEGQHLLSPRWMALLAGGFVFTQQQNNSQDGLPIFTKGIPKNYPTYKVGLRYVIRHKGGVEAVWGSYDVFNPYLLSSPFVQIGSEYKVGRKLRLYGYFRYQYFQEISVPLNKFLGLGVRWEIM